MIDRLQAGGSGVWGPAVGTDGISEEALPIYRIPCQQGSYRLRGGWHRGGQPDPKSWWFCRIETVKIVVDKLDEQRLEKLASAGTGTYHRLTHDDLDADALLAAMDSGHSAETLKRPG